MMPGTVGRAIPLALALGSLGCGVSEGDYLVYRVAVEAFRESEACYYPDEMKPPDVAQDADSHLVGQTWVIYFASGDRLLLDTGSAALDGEETDDGFSFVAHDVDVSYVGADQQEAKVTVITETTITMQVDGTAIAGNAKQRIRTACDFLIATPSQGLCEATPDCERDTNFAGVRLDDVDLTSGVDKPNPL